MSLARTLLVLLLVAGVAFAEGSSKPARKPSASNSGLQATLEKLEKQGWDAYKTHDQNAFKQLCAPEYTSVEADQGPVRDLQATIDAMKNFDLQGYSLSDIKATPLGPDAALLTYIANITLKMDGRNQDIKLGVTDVYVKRGGQWKSLRYHESAVK